MQSKQAAAGVFKVKNAGKKQHQTSSNQCLCYSCFLSKRVHVALWSSNCSYTVAIKTLSEPFHDRSTADEIARCSALLLLLFFSLMSPFIDFVDRKLFALVSTGLCTLERWGPPVWWRRWAIQQPHETFLLAPQHPERRSKQQNSKG